MSKYSLNPVLRFGLRALLLVPVFFVGETCTKLTEVPHDALTPTTAFHTDAEVLAGLAGVYAQMRPSEGSGEFATVEELTTDALVVPTRGSDWYDNGQWLDMHRQTWGPSTTGTLNYMQNSWNDLFSGVAKANLMIDVVSKGSAANKDTLSAELRTLRAWYYYMLQDMFGGVPLVTSTELKQVARSKRTEVFSFIETELTQSIPNLPDTWPSQFYGRVTKGVANAILASLYINAGVFNKDCGPAPCSGVSATSYNSCSGVKVSGGKDACQAALDAANAVINSGAPNYTYHLSANWADNFSLTNKSSPENIFVVVHTNSTQNIGMDWPMRTLHYNQLNTGDGSPWNGFATTAEYYAKFPAGDDRTKMWLVGQGYSFENGQPVKDRNGNPLIFTQTIPDLTKANESNGIRFNKFVPQADPPHGGAQPNDFTWFRLAEMYLIRAEASNECAACTGASNPIGDINTVRTRAKSAAVAPSGQAAIRQAILDERALEFAGEGKRRTDLVRFGQFLNWTESSANGVCGADPTKGCPARDAHLIVFPISPNSLGSNPLLVQNAGY